MAVREPNALYPVHNVSCEARHLPMRVTLHLCFRNFSLLWDSCEPTHFKLPTYHINTSLGYVGVKYVKYENVIASICESSI
jgi:hypothetical protein